MKCLHSLYEYTCLQNDNIFYIYPFFNILIRVVSMKNLDRSELNKQFVYHFMQEDFLSFVEIVFIQSLMT